MNLIERIFQVPSFRSKQRLVIMLACSIVLVTSLFSFLAYSFFSRQYDSRARLGALADILAASVEAPLVFDDREALAASTSVVKADPSIRQLFILDGAGRIISYYNQDGMRHRPQEQQRFLESVRVEARWGYLDPTPDAERPVVRGGVRLGTVIIEQDGRQLITQTAVTGGIGIAILLFSLVLSYLLAERFQRIITKPVTDLAATMRDVSLTKDYSKRVAAGDTVEMNQLAQSFNLMLAEIAQRDDRLRFTSTSVDTASDALFWMTPETRIVNVNAAACSSLGYAKEELLQLSMQEIDTRHDAQGMPQHFARLRQLGSMTYESEHRAKDGRVFPVEIVANYFQFGTEERNCAFVRDITARKLTEQALVESQQSLKLQFESMPVGCIVFDMHLRVRSWNPAAEAIFGYSAEEMIGNPPDALFGLSDRENCRDAIRKGAAATDGAPPSVDRNRTKDGSIVMCEWTNTPIRDKNGTRTGVISMVQDVTVRLKHEEEHLKIEKLESLGLLAGGIAHDFNNILTGIMGNISFAQMYLDATHHSHGPLLEAEKASSRARELAHQLLTFARGGAPSKTLVSVQRLVQESVSLMLRGSNVKAQVSIPDSLHALDADEGQMTQVFHNIIINALQAMPSGGSLLITAHNETLEEGNRFKLRGGSYVRIAFADEGCGIAAGDLQRVFDPYFSTKKSGTGLGLASSYSIVNKHDGKIDVSSVAGSGTTFTIYLPARVETYSESQNDARPSPQGHQGGTVLVMDDEEMIRNLASGMLSHLGYRPTTCCDGDQAIDCYREALQAGTPFSAVIMDLTIPGGMGGKEAAQGILALDPEACLIVSSGYSNDPVMSDSASYGFTGKLPKPYRADDLGEVLKSLLSSRQRGAADPAKCPLAQGG